jgi:hypothetical protein
MNAIELRHRNRIHKRQGENGGRMLPRGLDGGRSSGLPHELTEARFSLVDHRRARPSLIEAESNSTQWLT